MTTAAALLPTPSFVEQLQLIKKQCEELTAKQTLEIFNAWSWLAQKRGNFGQDVDIKEVMNVAEIGSDKPHPLVYDLVLCIELEQNQVTADPESAVESDLWSNHPIDSDPNYWKSEQCDVDSDFITKEINEIKSLLLRKDKENTLNELAEKMKRLSAEDRQYILDRIN